MINVVDVYCRDMFVYFAITKLLPSFYKKKSKISEKKICIWTINYDSLNKNTISVKQNRTIIIIDRVQLFFWGEGWEGITILVHFSIHVLLTILLYCDHAFQEIPY